MDRQEEIATIKKDLDVMYEKYSSFKVSPLELEEDVSAKYRELELKIRETEKSLGNLLMGETPIQWVEPLPLSQRDDEDEDENDTSMKMYAVDYRLDVVYVGTIPVYATNKKEARQGADETLQSYGSIIHADGVSWDSEEYEITYIDRIDNEDDEKEWPVYYKDGEEPLMVLADSAKHAYDIASIAFETNPKYDYKFIEVRDPDTNEVLM